MDSEKGVTLIALVLLAFVLLILSALAIGLAVRSTNEKIEPSSVYVESKSAEEIHQNVYDNITND
ncbi:MAG: hypothetical protein K6D97_05655 [Clostridia bacterium]|nr:hypothetical protein [Clostridia bacterium]